MNFKSMMTTVVVSMLLSCSLSASPIMSPVKCPSVHSIKSTDFISAKLMEENGYYLYQESNYDTNQRWKLGLGPFVADNEKEALEQGKKVINFLQFKIGPSNSKNAWTCLYKAENEKEVFLGIAAYQEDASVLPGQIKSLLNKKT